MPGFIITVLIAVLGGLIGDALLRNSTPGEFWGASLAGLIGSWIGAYAPFFNTVGPILWGAAVIPAAIGAVVGIFILSLFRGTVKQSG